MVTERGPKAGHMDINTNLAIHGQRPPLAHRRRRASCRQRREERNEQAKKKDKKEVYLKCEQIIGFVLETRM